MDDILNEISGINIGCRVGLNVVNIQAYADDIVILSPSIVGMQILLDKINILFNDHYLVANKEKTVLMIFNRNIRKITPM